AEPWAGAGAGPGAGPAAGVSRAEPTSEGRSGGKGAFWPGSPQSPPALEGRNYFTRPEHKPTGAGTGASAAAVAPRCATEPPVAVDAGLRPASATSAPSTGLTGGAKGCVKTPSARAG
ncbi:unnamed protein product, partial [Discosporangium mesarthrocarpum]